MKANKTVNYTNAKLNDWYKNVELDYGVIGSAKCTYNKSTNQIEILANENGEELVFKMDFYENENLDFYFNSWMEDPNQN